MKKLPIMSYWYLILLQNCSGYFVHRPLLTTLNCLHICHRQLNYYLLQTLSFAPDIIESKSDHPISFLVTIMFLFCTKYFI